MELKDREALLLVLVSSLFGERKRRQRRLIDAESLKAAEQLGDFADKLTQALEKLAKIEEG